MFAVMQLAGYTAPEADDLRKAIAKKQKDKLQKHRKKFINGAVKQRYPGRDCPAKSSMIGKSLPAMVSTKRMPPTMG